MYAVVRAAALLMALIVGAVATAAAQPADLWLDRPLAPWNAAGMAVPAAPPPSPGGPDDARCAATRRPAETPQDAALAAAGWTPYGPYRAGWGVVVIDALTGTDGMCRPLGYQAFVFVDGAFAGTISPVPMDARTDGAAGGVTFDASGHLWATFVRYDPSDALCCPSRPSTVVEYRVERPAAGPVVVPVLAMAPAAGP